MTPDERAFQTLTLLLAVAEQAVADFQALEPPAAGLVEAAQAVADQAYEALPRFADLAG